MLGAGGGKVFAAEVVDHGEAGSLVFDVGRGDEPAVGVVPLTKVAGQFAQEFLAGYGDALLAEVNPDKQVVFIIYKVRAKRGAIVLGRCEQREVENEKYQY